MQIFNAVAAGTYGAVLLKEEAKNIYKWLQSNATTIITKDSLGETVATLNESIFSSGYCIKLMTTQKAFDFEVKRLTKIALALEENASPFLEPLKYFFASVSLNYNKSIPFYVRTPGVSRPKTYYTKNGIYLIIMKELSSLQREVKDRNELLRKNIFLLDYVTVPLLHQLRFFHKELKMYHCDIKPDNIMFDTKSGFAVFTDIGMMKDINTASDKLNKGFLIVGTDGFVHPELRAKIHNSMLSMYDIEPWKNWFDDFEYPYTDNAVKTLRNKTGNVSVLKTSLKQCLENDWQWGDKYFKNMTIGVSKDVEPFKAGSDNKFDLSSVSKLFELNDRYALGVAIQKLAKTSCRYFGLPAIFEEFFGTADATWADNVNCSGDCWDRLPIMKNAETIYSKWCTVSSS